MRIYDVYDKHFVQWSLYAGSKKSGTSFKCSSLALYRWSLYIEKFDQKTQGRTTTWSLRTVDPFKKVVVKTDLTIYNFDFKTSHWTHELNWIHTYKTFIYTLLRSYVHCYTFNQSLIIRCSWSSYGKIFMQRFRAKEWINEWITQIWNLGYRVLC